MMKYIKRIKCSFLYSYYMERADQARRNYRKNYHDESEYEKWLSIWEHYMSKAYNILMDSL